MSGEVEVYVDGDKLTVCAHDTHRMVIVKLDVSEASDFARAVDASMSTLIHKALADVTFERNKLAADIKVLQAKIERLEK